MKWGGGLFLPTCGEVAPKASEGHGRRGPLRTCVACREEGGKRELVRFVRGPGGVVTLDRTGRAPGRGAYLHATPECVEVARKRKALDRALAASVPAEVWAEVSNSA